MAPGSIFHHISFWSTILVSYLLPLQSFTFCSINQKYQKYYFTVYPSLSDLTLRITVKGLTTPLSCWLQVGVCLCRYSVACCVISYWIDTLVLKTEGNTYTTLLHHPFLFKGKPTHAQEVAWCYFEAKVWQKDSNIVPSLFLSHFLAFLIVFLMSGGQGRAMVFSYQSIP